MYVLLKALAVRNRAKLQGTQGFNSLKMVIWLFLLKIAAIAVQVHGQSPQGFISIDCGIASNTSYVDPTTTISYVSDDQYVSTGSIHDIDARYNSSLLPPVLSNLRSFTIGDRNCYTVPVVQDQRYLVRAWFLYGNYDGKNSASVATPLQFDLLLGANLWANINITDPSIPDIEEALTLTTTTSVSICLINTGKGDPFISGLELRPLKSSMYNLSQSDLALTVRVNMGSLTGDIVRYPTDPYDRIWEPLNLEPSITISTNLSVDSQGDGFEVPSAVLQTALTPSQGTTLTDGFISDSAAEQFYNVLYFVEVEVLGGNAVRKFNIYRNGELRAGNFTPSYLSSGYVFSRVPFNGSASYIYSLNATEDSTLPPLINAAEIYSIMPVAAA